jgi:hypothetical protein
MILFMHQIKGKTPSLSLAQKNGITHPLHIKHASAIVKVPEQVGAARSARRKVGNRVPGRVSCSKRIPRSRVPRKRFPSKVSKQGAQEQVPK